MHVAVLEDRLGQVAGAVGQAQHRHELRLHVGGKAGVGRGLQVDRARSPIVRHADAAVIGGHLRARGLQRGDGRGHLARIGAGQINLAAACHDRAGIAARLDTVGHHAIGRTVQPIDALDGQRVATDPVDMHAHRHQAVAQVDDLGLARRVADDAGPVRAACRHQRIFGRAHRNHGKIDAPARQPSAARARGDIARRHLDLRAERLDRLEVQVDGAVADRASARQADLRLAHPREQRAQHQDRRTHLAHDVIGRDRRGHRGRARGHHPPEILGPRSLDGGGDAELVQQMPEPVDIGEPGQVAQRQRLVGEQGTGKQGKRAVLRPRHRNTTREALPTANDDLIHAPL